MERAAKGDQQAFEALYRQHVGRVYGLCLRLSGDVARAEELTQDVFVRAWEKLGTFRGRSAFGTWLHRLAANTVHSASRSDVRREKRVVATDDPALLDCGSSRGNGAEGLDLERAIAALPDGARSVFVLHEVEGYRHEEIAALNGCAVGTSKAQLHRARKLLQEMLV